MPCISIVVPIYNCQEYLVGTLESLRAQTLQDIEIICVNDGSSDLSLEIVQAYAKLDKRIKVFNQENRGVSSARNCGICHAQAPYIAFLDSDDFYTAHACECMYKAAQSQQCDIVVFGGIPYPKLYSYPWIKRVLDVKSAKLTSCGFDDIRRYKGLTPFVWNKLFSRDFLLKNNFFFEEKLPFGEDLVFLLPALVSAKGIVCISDKLISYRLVREGSLMHGRTSAIFERNCEHLEMLEYILDSCSKLPLTQKDKEELIVWVASFVLGDILTSPPQERRDLALKLQALFDKWVSPEQQKYLCKDSGYARAASMVLDETSLVTGWKKRFVVADFVLKQEGVGFFVRRTFEFLRNRLIKPIDRRALEAATKQEGRFVSEKDFSFEKLDQDMRIDAWEQFLRELQESGRVTQKEIDQLAREMSFSTLPQVYTKEHKREQQRRMREHSKQLKREDEIIAKELKDR